MLHHTFPIIFPQFSTIFCKFPQFFQNSLQLD